MIALFEHFVMRPTRQKRIDKKFDIFWTLSKTEAFECPTTLERKGWAQSCRRFVSGWLAKNGFGMSSGLRSRWWKKTTEERVCRFWVCWDHNHRFFLFREKLVLFSSSSSSKWLFFSGVFSSLVSVQPLLGIRRYDKVYVVNSNALCDVTGWRGVCLHFFKFSRS